MVSRYTIVSSGAGMSGSHVALRMCGSRWTTSLDYVGPQRARKTDVRHVIYRLISTVLRPSCRICIGLDRRDNLAVIQRQHRARHTEYIESYRNDVLVTLSLAAS
jgi:hypothetical protein